MKDYKYMLYAHDGAGIGHAVRVCTLAGAIRSLSPNAAVSVVTGSPVARDYLPTGVQLFQLPPQVRIHADDYGTAMGLLRAERRRLTVKRRQLILEYTRDWKPDVLLIDHLPLGKREEMDSTVQLLHSAGKTVLLGYRRILEDRGNTEKIFTFAPFRATLLSCFKAVIVYAPPWIEKAHGPLSDIPLPQVHVGFVCRREAWSKEAARWHFGLRIKCKLVACCLGGGRDSWPLARAILESWRCVNPAGSDAHLLFFAGPHLSAPESELRSYATENCVSIVRNSPHFPRGIAAADAVLSTGGYNSMLETLVQGRPLWVIPNQDSECEQQNSSRYLEQLGLVKQVQFGDGLKMALRKTFQDILRALSTKKVDPCMPSGWFQGENNAARLLRRCIEDKNHSLPLKVLG